MKVQSKLSIQTKDLDWLARALKLPETLSESPLLEGLLGSLPAIALEAWPADSEVLREGERSDDFFVVYTGTLSVWRANALRSNRRIGKLSAGDFFGEIGFLLKSARSATVRTDEHCRLFRFPAAEFSRTLKRHHALDRWVKQVACARIAGIFLDAA
jgi:CRP-like cAMP-binding protein